MSPAFFDFMFVLIVIAVTGILWGIMILIALHFMNKLK